MSELTIDRLTDQIAGRLVKIQTDGHWLVGQTICDVLVRNKAKSKVVEVCRTLAEHPNFNLSYSYLRQCIRTYTYYPDLASRQLPEAVYHVLANQVYREEDRNRLEELAIKHRWNANQLSKEIRKERLSNKELRKSELGFDLQITNLWYFNTSDPRFGKPEFRGRIAGQIIANALYYFAGKEGLIVDPFAGSGTLGDVVDKLPVFSKHKYSLFDLNPVDERIKFNDVTLDGIPAKDKSASYVFLDPPYGNIGQNYYGSSKSDLSRMSSEGFLAVLYSVIRECGRVLSSRRNVSLIIEPLMPFDDLFIDLPRLLSNKFIEEGFIPLSKVYIPNQTMRNTGSMPNIIAHSRTKRNLISDCRELITFQKLP